jgi:hypothetical protein
MTIDEFAYLPIAEPPAELPKGPQMEEPGIEGHLRAYPVGLGHEIIAPALDG